MILHYYNSEGEQCNMAVVPDDNSYRYRAIMGEHSLTINFSLSEYADIPVGAWCEHENERYTLEKPANFTKKGERNYEYTLVMQSEQYLLSKFILRNIIPGDTRLKFSYTARPHEFLNLIVKNMNDRDEGWSTRRATSFNPTKRWFRSTTIPVPRLCK
jgi:hypothetical protein